MPPEGKSHALRRRDGKRLSLHGTAPASPEDMPQPAGKAYPETSAGVPEPPLHRPFGGLDRLNSSKNKIKRFFKEKQQVVTPVDMREDSDGPES